MKYQKHIAGGAGGGIKLYLDFNQTSALSDNNFNRAIRFRSPIAALSVHRLSGVQFPSLLRISNHRLRLIIHIMISRQQLIIRKC